MDPVSMCQCVWMSLQALHRLIAEQPLTHGNTHGQHQQMTRPAWPAHEERRDSFQTRPGPCEHQHSAENSQQTFAEIFLQSSDITSCLLGCLRLHRILPRTLMRLLDTHYSLHYTLHYTLQHWLWLEAPQTNRVVVLTETELRQGLRLLLSRSSSN